jgi:hypothetical protein
LALAFLSFFSFLNAREIFRMKKSILALGAAAVVGGLGLATSAQAVVYFNAYGQGTNTVAGTSTIVGSPTIAAAASLELNPGGTGHELIVPYYSVQQGTGTSISIVNSDSTNGKAVKVRFRGAANSDDVLDFTVFLSPSDVWTASVSEDANGLANLSTSDKSCTLPSVNDGWIKDGQPQNAIPFGLVRFPSYMTTAQQNANTREGYIEILNMADIPPNNAAGSLYTAIKHVNGVPPCTQAPFNLLLDQITNVDAATLLGTYGLDTPTGGLYGSWAVINQTTLGQFSGADTAVRAVVPNPTPATTASKNGYTYVAYSPQRQLGFLEHNNPGAGGVDSKIDTVSADPLLRGAVPAVQPQQYDVPDLSTPLIPTALQKPTQQAYNLSAALGKTVIENEYANDPSGAQGVPFSTDWVISQPTRRYFAVVDYAGSAATASIVTNINNDNGGDPAFAATFNNLVPGQTVAGTGLPYWASAGGARSTLQLRQGTNGPVAALGGAVTVYDREEGTTSGAQFSPGVSGVYNGEVATLTFGTSPLNASLTNTPSSGGPAFGWAVFTPTVGLAGFIPVTGFAAEAGFNQTLNRGVGATLPFRW